MKSSSFGKIAGIVAAFCFAAIAVSNAQVVFTTLYKIEPPGGDAISSLVQGLNGSFYRTMYAGGASVNKKVCAVLNQYRCGTVFELTPSGQYTVIYDFCAQANCADGGTPVTLILGTDGNFYGTTSAGGANTNSQFCLSGCGTAFKLTPEGSLTTLYNFCSQPHCSDGLYASSLVQARNGSFYGVTEEGGTLNQNAGCPPSGCGTLFELSPAGKFTTTYKFCSVLSQNGGCADGLLPLDVIQATNGNFYGTTYYGGANDAGTIFEITPAGKYSRLYSFCSPKTSCADGRYPSVPLIQATDGILYGTTSSGGTYDGGTTFQVTLTKQFTTLYSFCNAGTGGSCPGGSYPGGIVQASDGNLYATAVNGGDANGSELCVPTGCGTAFELTSGGQLDTLYTFCTTTTCPDGAYPGGLMQATNGTFYGSTFSGAGSACGGIGCGTIFSLSTGLGPFVAANPNVSVAGRVVKILGNKLTGTSSVTFNGVVAKFKVISDTYMEARVPSGATTGPIQVTMPSGTLTSKVAFQILP